VTDIDLDIDVDRRACGHRGGEAVDADGRVDRDAHTDAFGQFSESGQLRRGHDFVGDEDVVDALGRERDRLVDLLHAHPDGSRRPLQSRDGRAFVRLGMRSKPQSRRFRVGRHGGDVALEGIEVDDERRRVDRVDGVADTGGRCARHGA
jgi:hypothetical protein